MGRFVGLVLLLWWGVAGCFTPAEATDNEFQQWNLVTLQLPVSKVAPVSEKVKLYLEAQPRLGDELENLDTLLVRPAIGYQVTPHISIWQGYAWIPSFQPQLNQEHRVFQQLLTNHDVKKLNITNRTRMEQRFIEGAGDPAYRLRHMVRLAHPIRGSKKWQLVGYNEVFMNLNSTPSGPKAGFNQNRLYVGVNRKINKHLNGEVGYIWNYINTAQPAADRMNHVLMVTVNMNL